MPSHRTRRSALLRRAVLAASLIAALASVGCGGAETPTAPPAGAGSSWDEMSWDQGSWS